MAGYQRGYPLTGEQQSVVTTEPEPLLVVNAYAGTGKTSTLVAFAAARPDKRFLYLAYNRAIRDEAKTKFGANVTCLTTHGLAYQSVGVLYKEKLGELNAYVVSKSLRVDYQSAASALRELQSWLQSPDPVLKHAAAKKLWNRMRAIDDKDVPMSHDGYLKLFSLQASGSRYDYVLLDEAQDSNPVIVQLLRVLHAAGAKLVIVGDRYQSIYGYRGVVNLLDTREGQRLTLSRSFRYPQEIAELATGWLHRWFPRDGVHIEGVARPLATPTDAGCTVICRTNAGVLEAAFDAVMAGNRVSFVGGFDGYRFERVVELSRLAAGLPVTDRFLAKFKSLDELRAYVDESGDAELTVLLSMFKKYGLMVPDIVAKVKAAVTQRGGLTLTTAHKAKGLEWDNIRLHTDFPVERMLAGKAKVGHEREFMAWRSEEARLGYVAMTRAKSGAVLGAIGALAHEQKSQRAEHQPAGLEWAAA